MRLMRLSLSFIRSFRQLDYDLKDTRVLIGQNDHGKSSILKVLDIVFNRITEEMIENRRMDANVAEQLLTIFSTNAKARRITLHYDLEGEHKQLHISLRPDFSFIIHSEIKRGTKHEQVASRLFTDLQKATKFLLIPAVRDASSDHYAHLLEQTLHAHGLSSLMPRNAGGTTKQYRQLKKVRDTIQKEIIPYVDSTLIPQLTKVFSFPPEHRFELSFDVSVPEISSWISSNLKLGFQLGDATKKESAILPLKDAGTGVQSAVLLALHHIRTEAAKNPTKTYYLAIEEPESYLHPQHQRELFANIRARESENLFAIVTTHSPYIVADADFTSIGIVRKSDRFSSLHVPAVVSDHDAEVFNRFSDEVNSLLFFADKVVLVEGDSDRAVLRALLKKKYGPRHHRISIIVAGGNQQFSPYLKMLRCWKTLKIPFLVVTDFDSLTKENGRAILRGTEDAGVAVANVGTIHQAVDNALDKDERAFRGAGDWAMAALQKAGLDVFVFTSDIEYTLLTDANFKDATKIMSQEADGNKDYSAGYDLMQLKRTLGSKGVPLNKMAEPPLKKVYVHAMIAETIDPASCHPDLHNLLNKIEQLS
jgi:putative ATP-dependent endonuclease of OLD family